MHLNWKLVLAAVGLWMATVVGAARASPPRGGLVGPGAQGGGGQRLLCRP